MIENGNVVTTGGCSLGGTALGVLGLGVAGAIIGGYNGNKNFNQSSKRTLYAYTILNISAGNNMVNS